MPDMHLEYASRENIFSCWIICWQVLFRRPNYKRSTLKSQVNKASRSAMQSLKMHALCWDSSLSFFPCQDNPGVERWERRNTCFNCSDTLIKSTSKAVPLSLTKHANICFTFNSRKMASEQHNIDFSQSWTYSDIIFVTEGAKKVHANKMILSLWSPVFEAMFRDNFKEKTAKEIELPGKEFKSVMEMMEVLHPPNKDISSKNLILPDIFSSFRNSKLVRNASCFTVSCSPFQMTTFCWSCHSPRNIKWTKSPVAVKNSSVLKPLLWKTISWRKNTTCQNYWNPTWAT